MQLELTQYFKFDFTSTELLTYLDILEIYEILSKILEKETLTGNAINAGKPKR